MRPEGGPTRERRAGSAVARSRGLHTLWEGDAGRRTRPKGFASSRSQGFKDHGSWVPSNHTFRSPRRGEWW
jgi:hypothetical protein